MFILAVKGFEEDGAFSIENDDGDRVLLMFEEEDDADNMLVVSHSTKSTCLVSPFCFCCPC